MFGKKDRLTNVEVFNKIEEYFYTKGKDLDICKLFREDSQRFNNFSKILRTPSDGNILVDYSKNRITAPLLEKLFELAKVRKVEETRDAMMKGAKINRQKKQPVLHCALRMVKFKRRKGEIIMVDNYNIIDECIDQLKRMCIFVDVIISKQWVGANGHPLAVVIVISHGGFSLASQMVIRALAPYNKGLKFYFVTNVDGSNISNVLKNVNRNTVLFVIASDNFDDLDIIQNATTAKNWFLKHSKRKHMERHFVAITTHIPNAKHFGVHPKNIFRYGEYVGECYAVWSSIGLPVALSIGTEAYMQFLAGAYFMDEHFKTTPMSDNIPIILAMIGIWYTNFYKTETQAIFPYDEYLNLFPSYAQLLQMKCNGKCYMGLGGITANFNTGTVVWGGTGTNCEHSFYQLLQQGTRLVPCDFIIPAKSHNPINNNEHHKILVASFLGHAEALMKGKIIEEDGDRLNIHKTAKGNNPSNAIVLSSITPYTIGALMALYEHKTLVQSIIWDIDPFVHPYDEFGSKIAASLLKYLDNPWKQNTWSQSTIGLSKFIRRSIEPQTCTDYCNISLEYLLHLPASKIILKGEVFNVMILLIVTYFWYIYYSYPI